MVGPIAILRESRRDVASAVSTQGLHDFWLVRKNERKSQLLITRMRTWIVEKSKGIMFPLFTLQMKEREKER